MSKLIVEMEMPTSCEKCKSCDYEQGQCLLSDDRSTLPHNGKRRSWCPIIGELPEEHGRLVDADACSSVLRKLGNETKINTEKLCYRFAARMFEEAVTIIAAEKKDGTNKSQKSL